MIKRVFVVFSVIIVMLANSIACADPAFVNRPDVIAFINLMVTKHHFKKNELLKLFSAIKIRPRIMASMKAPLEIQPWSAYQPVFINESHIREGVKYWQRNKQALQRAEAQYGVPASIIVATIGVETKYGKNRGDYPVIDALANIGFSDSRRASYFRQELEDFLLLTREQHLNPYRVLGSYAGAIGQPQFMPSSYRNYAINFSGNGHIDLSNNETDIIGSIANYYQKHGWKTNTLVALPTAKLNALILHKISSKKSHSLAFKNNTIYPFIQIPAQEQAHIIALKGYQGNEFWLSFHNFDVIKRYNASNLYAMAVYQLSYYIQALRESSKNG